MGVGFAQFGLRARAAIASHLLLTTGLTAQHVAERSGFVDASHLHRAFVNYYHCTPTEYRQRLRT